MATVAAMLEEAMRRKNMSQQRLAKETGITAPWINMILRRGRAAGPTALLKIAEVLGIDKTKLVRQAHFERAYDEWRSYLEREEAPRRAEDGQPTGMVPLIGKSSGAGSAVEIEEHERADGPRVRKGWSGETADAPGAYPAPERFVGFDAECKAVRVEGDGLEPVAYDGQYVVVSPKVRKENIPDGAIVYLTYELPGEPQPRAMIRRMYRYRLPGDEGGKGLPVYNLVPVNTRLRRMKGPLDKRDVLGAPEGAVTLRHRQVREMYPVVGVIFGSGAPE